MQRSAKQSTMSQRACCARRSYAMHSTPHGRFGALRTWLGRRRKNRIEFYEYDGEGWLLAP